MMLARSLKVAGRRRPVGVTHFRSLSSTPTASAAGATHHDESSSSLPSIQLYQYQICPFCNKAKALLSYIGVPYKPIEVNPLTKREIKWSTEHRKVPIMTMDGQHVFDSDNIMDALVTDARLAAQLQDNWGAHSGMSMELFRSPDARHWRDFASHDLASLLYPNICRSLGAAYQAFGYVENVPSFSPFQKASIRSLGALAMYFAAGKVKKKRNINDERQALNDVLHKLETEGLQGRAFLSRVDEPHMGDLAVFGALRSIEGLPTHDEVVQERGGRVAEWYDRMQGKMRL